MQHSKNNLYVKRIIKAVLFLLIFIMFNIVACIVLELPETESERMLTEYTKKDEIETVILGNSVAKVIYDEVFSEETGSATYNMYTPDQPYSVSLKALQLAASQHDIQSVILVTTFDAQSNDNKKIIEKIYDRTYDASMPMAKRLKNDIYRKYCYMISPDVFYTEESINVWFPWVNETVTTFKERTDNIKRRATRIINGERLGSDYSYELDEVKYERSSGDLNIDDVNLLDADIDKMNNLPLPDDMMDEESIRNLACICRFCDDNDIELSVWIIPHRQDYFERYQGFAERYNIIDDFFDDFISKRGFMYYNFDNCPDIHTLIPDDYYDDWEHIGLKHKEYATKIFAEKYNELRGK